MTSEVRALTPDDAGTLQAFFQAIPAEDRTFFFQDVDDPAVAERWTADERAAPRGVFDESGQLVAFAALRPGNDWSAHVADMVLLVAPAGRRSGVGRTMARDMLVHALERGYKKVTVVIPADNTGALTMFQKMGFEPEALLRDQLCSPQDGTLRDVAILAHLVDDNWSTMLTGGYEEALT